MTQQILDEAVARATGEDVRTIDWLGFVPLNVVSVMDPDRIALSCGNLVGTYTPIRHLLLARLHRPGCYLAANQTKVLSLIKYVQNHHARRDERLEHLGLGTDEPKRPVVDSSEIGPAPASSDLLAKISDIVPTSGTSCRPTLSALTPGEQKGPWRLAADGQES